MADGVESLAEVIWSSYRYALFSIIKGKIKNHFQFLQYSVFAFKGAYDSHCVYFIREPDI